VRIALCVLHTLEYWMGFLNIKNTTISEIKWLEEKGVDNFSGMKLLTTVVMVTIVFVIQEYIPCSSKWYFGILDGIFEHQGNDDFRYTWKEIKWLEEKGVDKLSGMKLLRIAQKNHWG